MAEACEAAASAPARPDVSFWAVGGASEHRIQRKLLLDRCCPAVASRSFALEGSLYGSDKPFRIPSWITAVLETPGSDAPECKPCSLSLEKDDLLLVIGHLHDDEFAAHRTLHPRLPDDHIWVQGGSKSSFNLKTAIGHSIDGADCPDYTMGEWSAVLKLYPEVLIRMRAFQWGGFWTSRLPSLIREDEETGLAIGAFYRQFGLRPILEKGKMLDFEKEVLQNSMDTEQTRRVLRQIEETVKGQSHDDIAALYRAYSDNGPWNDEDMVASITQSLLQVIPRYADLNIKEYDSFVTHLMMRHCAGLTDELTPAFHIAFVESCLRSVSGKAELAEGSPEAAFDTYVEQLRAGLASRRILVLHDLGLDPMSDDWLAAALLLRVTGITELPAASTAAAEPPSLEATEAAPVGETGTLTGSSAAAGSRSTKPGLAFKDASDGAPTDGCVPRTVVDIFATFDNRGDGMYSCSELADLLRNLDKSSRMTTKHIEGMLEAIDRKNEGWIHYEAFCKWVFNGIDETWTASSFADLDRPPAVKTIKLCDSARLSSPKSMSAETEGRSGFDDEEELPLPSSTHGSDNGDACLLLRMALDTASSSDYYKAGLLARTETNDLDRCSSRGTIKMEASSGLSQAPSASLGASAATLCSSQSLMSEKVRAARTCWTKMMPPPWAKDAMEGTVTLVSLAQDQNEEFRSYMEDGQKVVDPLTKNHCVNGDRWGFFAVYDGHGGREEVEYCESTLHNVVLDMLGNLPQEQDVATALREAFLKVDSQLGMLGAWKSGCTATVALVHRRDGSATLHVANVGDSRAVMMGGAGAAQRISKDHRCSDPSEAARIKEEGGIIRYNRVGGALSVSRSLGDHYLKGSGVSSVPEVSSCDVVDDRALVIASDGLWDALEDAEACELLANCMDRAVARGGDQQEIAGYLRESAASELVEVAKERGSKDNILAMVVFF